MQTEKESKPKKIKQKGRIEKMILLTVLSRATEWEINSIGHITRGLASTFLAEEKTPTVITKRFTRRKNSI